jgi:serine/threonine protein kinase
VPGALHRVAMAKPAAAGLQGTRIQQFEIANPLGAGAMGVVYKAWDSDERRWVALKFLASDLEYDATARRELASEGRLASTLKHPNLCTVHGCEVTADGRVFIAMQCYDGVTLQQQLRGRRISIGQALRIAAQLADALAFLHRKGITHGDVKPGNVMVTGDGIRLLDFGLAIAHTSHEAMPPASPMRGTTAYMAPEQFRGEVASPRSDLWALGVVIFEMLAGRLPFPGLYPEAISYAVRNKPLPRLRGQAGTVPPAIEQVVLRLLQKNPSRRYANAAVLARDLRALTPIAVPMARPARRMAS